MGKWVDVPDGKDFTEERWLTGRYEADLCGENPTVYLVLGESYPTGRQMIPVGTNIRRPEKRVR